MRILILGANGQVGREVCLFLHCLGADVIPVSRSLLGGVFLERCGLTCRVGSVARPDDAVALLRDADMVADFSAPRGGLQGEVRPSVSANIENCLQYAPARIPFVYISTVSAFGMRHGEAPLRKYLLPHSRYAADKRHYERVALDGGHDRPVFVLRLGQVHGELQAVSMEFRREVRDQVHLPFPPETLSYTVFAYSIAETLLHIGRGMEQPGRYSLVSVPQWSWREVYEYWSRREGIDATITGGPTMVQSPLVAPVRRWVAQRVVAHRDLLTSYGLGRSPRLQERAQAAYLRRRATNELAAGGPPVTRSFWPGEVPGNRLVSLSDSRTSMDLATEWVRRLIADAPRSTSLGSKPGFLEGEAARR